MPKGYITQKFIMPILAGSALLFGLYLLSLYSYLLFHAITELFGVVITLGIFMVAWNSRKFLDNNYFIFIGIAFLFVSGINLIHIFSHESLGLFPGFGTNLSDQSWIIGRYVQSLSFLIAPLVMRRRIKVNVLLLAYFMISSLLLASLFLGKIFPEYPSIHVSTLINNINQYILSIISLGSIFTLWINSREFDSSVLKLLVASIMLSILSNVTATFSANIHDIFNMASHFFNVASYYIVYKAIVVTGLTKPYNLLFRNLKQSEIALQEARDELEIRVLERTRELRNAYETLNRREQELEKIFESTADGVALVDTDGQVIRANNTLSKVLKIDLAGFFNQPVDSIKGKEGGGWEILRSNESPMPLEERAVSLALKEKRTIKNIEEGIKHSDGSISWLEVSAAPIVSSSGVTEGIVFTITDVTEQKRLRQDLEYYSQRITQIQEEERKRIARELHDDASQSLAILSLELDFLLSSKEIYSSKSLERLKHLKDNIDRTQQDIRRYSHELHPSLLDHLGLVAALEQLVEEINERGKVEVNLEVRGEERKLDDDVELALFRIAQESLNNTWKHAEAAKAKISLKYLPNEVTLGVTDNGKGFDVSKESDSALTRGSLGLLSMKERAHLIGAKLKINSKLNVGTRVSLELKI